MRHVKETVRKELKADKRGGKKLDFVDLSDVEEGSEGGTPASGTRSAKKRRKKAPANRAAEEEAAENSLELPDGRVVQKTCEFMKLYRGQEKVYTDMGKGDQALRSILGAAKIGYGRGQRFDRTLGLLNLTEHLMGQTLTQPKVAEDSDA